MEKDVPSDPYAELSFRSDEQAGRTIELHLGDRGITRLIDFHAFLSLDTLWLNDNKLKSIAGLENNFRIRHLYLHNNRIRRLKGGLRYFKFLQHVCLYGNLLDDLETTLNELSSNKYLEQLELMNNPIAQEDNYRLLVIINIPWLKTLDRLNITQEERKEATILKQKMESLKDFKFGSKKPPPTEEEIANKKRKEEVCASALASMKEHITAKRIMLETYFIPFDPRNLGLIDISVFQETLKELDLSRTLDEGEEDTLIEKYSSKVPSTVKDIDLRKTIPTRWALDYKRLCSDLVPAALRVLEDDWKPEFNGEMSATTIALEKYVTTVRKRLEAEEAERRKSALLSRSDADEKVFTTDRKPYTCEEHGLTAWQNAMVSKHLKQYMTDAGAMSLVEKPQLTAIFNYLEVQGLKPECGAKNARTQLMNADSSEENSNANGCTIATICAAFGIEGVVKYNELKDAENKQSCPFIRWTSMQQIQKKSVAEREFGDAGISLDTLLRMDPGDDTTNQMAVTMKQGTNGTRLLADFKKMKKKPEFATPKSIMKKMAKRADAIVLPSLNAAEAKRKKEDEIMNQYDFTSHFAKLGLTGDALELALTRKKRSILGSVTEAENAAALKSKEEANNKINNGKGENNGEIKPKKSYVAEFLRAPMYKKGWNAATGTITLSDYQ